MGKNLKFRKAFLMGVMPILLGMGGCSLTWDDPVYFESEEPTAQTESFSDLALVEEGTGLDVPCADEDDCEAADDYLTQRFSQTETLANDPNMANEDMISLSRPAGQKALSVKDKQKTITVSETTAATLPAEATPLDAPAPVKEKSVVAQPVKEQLSEDKILYTTVAIPEAIGTNTTTETTLTTTKIIKNPSETPAEAVPEGMMPLKKTVTTITETTTKVKKEKEPQKNFGQMTLAEKVAYGESVQEWDAQSGTTMQSLLMDWGSKSGWTVIWKLDRDYYLEAGVIFRGTFMEVSSALIRSFARATPAPIGTFHQGNQVLVISTQEDENER